MKKLIVVGLILFVTSLYAEVVTVAANVTFLNYTDAKKSSATTSEFYINSGTLSYLTEFDYSRTDMTYNNSVKTLSQDEFTFVYSRYFLGYSYKFGLHMNSTTDTDLENGTTTIVGINGWKYFGYSKLIYGLDYYYSTYANGTDLNLQKKSIIVNELSGYCSYYAPFTNVSNLVLARVNYENIEAYEESYTSFEFVDTLYFRDTEVSLKGFFGKMQTGVRGGGMIVYNLKDMLKNEFSLNVAYHFDKNFKLNIAASQSKSDEYFGLEITTNSITVGASYKL